ncbi:unnamed protein product [Lepeophtheirus salmonis]|uniref:(salmon louse) hypothetical protein n=1 Tax=Lepeophtheirus salmonis TaxID=72036 RepID=A0A7R8HBJ7_LEPSM|nr:unnamed protein product [Lepeophtheirus salmonis]CAF2982516.1 unnamed protein product [Lepeophtheirus salmonis]
MIQNTVLNTTYGHCSNNSNFLDILKRETKRLVCGTSWGNDVVEGVQKGGSRCISFLTSDFPSLLQELGASFQHVVSVTSGDGNEGNCGGAATDILDVIRDFLLDFFEARGSVESILLTINFFTLIV